MTGTVLVLRVVAMTKVTVPILRKKQNSEKSLNTGANR